MPKYVGLLIVKINKKTICGLYNCIVKCFDSLELSQGKRMFDSHNPFYRYKYLSHLIQSDNQHGVGGCKQKSAQKPSASMVW